MQTTEERRAYFRAYDARRSVADPAFRARKAEKSRAQYLKLRADPDRYAAMADRCKHSARARRAAIKDDPAGWLRLLLKSAAARASKRGLAFTITTEDIPLPTHCPVFGWTLHYGSTPRDLAGASLDRLNNTLGYVPGNVRIVSWRANDLRRDCDDPALFEALAKDARQINTALDHVPGRAIFTGRGLVSTASPVGELAPQQPAGRFA